MTTIQHAVVWGAGRRLRRLRPMLADRGVAIALLMDRNPSVPDVEGVVMLKGSEPIEAWFGAADSATLPDGFVIAIGGALGGDRMALAWRFSLLGMKPITLVHPKAWVSSDAAVGEGCQIMPLAAVCGEARLGEQSIVETNAILDFGCQVGSGVHVHVGAVIGAGAVVGDRVVVGANATILPGVRVGVGAVIEPGTVISADVTMGHHMAGDSAHRVWDQTG